MTMKHISFIESEVMRSLERQAVKKGTFSKETVSVDKIVKNASIQRSFVPTEDLHADLIKLANGLRERGFSKEADALENKIFIKKQAEVHLYRAFDEDGEDVIDFAHSDGDQKVSDAQNQNGMVETILSQHKKIVDVVNKQPSGKYAKTVDNLILATAEVLDVNLRKISFVESPLNVDEENTEKFHQNLALLKSAMYKLSGILVGQNLKPQFEAFNEYLNNPPNLGITSSHKLSVLNDFITRFEFLKQFLEGTKERESLKIVPGQTSTFNSILAQVLNLYNTTVSFLSSLAGKSNIGYLQHKIDPNEIITEEKAKEIQSVFIGCVKLLEEFKSSATGNAQTKADQYVNAANNYAYLLGLIKSDQRYSKLFNALISLDSKNSALVNVEALENAASSFHDSVMNFVGKRSYDQNKSLEKSSQSSLEKAIQKALTPEPVPVPAAVAPGTVPLVAPQTGIPSLIGPTSNKPSKQTSQAPGVSSQEVQDVKLMQDSLNSLGASLESSNIDRNELIKLRDTGHGTNIASGDGIWGPRTTTALETANKLFKLNLVTTHNSSTATKDAQSNYLVIQQVLKRVGLGREGYVVYDKLPAVVSQENIDADASAGANIPLTAKDLNSLATLFGYLEKNNITINPSSPTQKQDNEIGLTNGEWLFFLTWLKKRAANQYNKATNEKPAKREYFDKVAELTTRYGALTSKLKITNPDTVISPNILGSVEILDEKGRGSTYQQETGESPEGEDYRIKSRQRGAAIPPIGEVIDLRHPFLKELLTKYPGLVAHRLSLEDFQTNNGENMAEALFTNASASIEKGQLQKVAQRRRGFRGIPGGFGFQDYSPPPPPPPPSPSGPYVAYDQSPQMQPLDSSSSSKQKYQSFLVDLRAQLGRAFNQWSAKAPPAVEDAVREIYQDWMKAIRKQFSDIRF